MEIDIQKPDCDVHEVWFQFYNYIAWKHNGCECTFNIHELHIWIRQTIYDIDLKDTIKIANQFIEIWQTLGIIKDQHNDWFKHVTDKNIK